MAVPTARRRRAGWRLVAVLLLATAGCTARSTAAPAPPSTAPSSPVATASPVPTTATAIATAPATTRRPAPTPATPTTVTSTPTAPASTPTTVRNARTSSAAPSLAGGDCVAGRCFRVGPVHELPDGVAPESSGIAASSTLPGAFFLVDDATGTGEIVAVGSDGSLVARLAVAGMSARNAEALAAGPCGTRAGRCLYIGDIGDNAAARAGITVYRVGEPALSAPPRTPLPADAWRYTYPDGPHNAEALVAGPGGSLLVLTKSAPDPTSGQVPPHRIYRAPAGGGRLVFVSSYRPPTPALPVQSLFTGTVVTDASYSAGRLLLLTYDEVVEYRAPQPGADPADFPGWPHSALPAPSMIQSEGITADLSGCGYEVTSERGPDGSRSGMAGVACG